jgi:plastocyanin
MRAALVLALTLAATCLAAFPGGADEKEGKKTGNVHVVKMKGDNTFDPPEVTAKVGDQVKWVNEGGTHTATADDQTDLKKSFNTGTVKKGQEATFNCNNAGTIPYHCEYHNGMKGKITVE